MTGRLYSRGGRNTKTAGWAPAYAVNQTFPRSHEDSGFGLRFWLAHAFPRTPSFLTCQLLLAIRDEFAPALAIEMGQAVEHGQGDLVGVVDEARDGRVVNGP